VGEAVSEQELTFYCCSRSHPGESYQVCVTFTEEELLLSCDCPAGTRTVLCHHLSDLVANRPAGLLEPHSADQLQDLAMFQTWLNDTCCREDIDKLHALSNAVKEQKKHQKVMTDNLQGGWKRRSFVGGS